MQHPRLDMISPAVARLSRVWFPSGGIAVSGVEDAHGKLIRAGFLRQSHAGMFHMLPLGRRVQDKIERLVAGHMEESLCEFQTILFSSAHQAVFARYLLSSLARDPVAASRVSLSSISAESLWERSGRLQSVASEVRFGVDAMSQRKRLTLVLSP